MVDLSSTVWSPKERLAWREAITPPLGVISLVLCIGAAIIYHIFPRLRVFPRSILSWLNFYNILFSVYIIVKWFPGSIHEAMVLHLRPDTAACRLGLFFDNFTMSGLGACDTLIALTLFLVVKMEINLEVHKTRFYEAYLAFAVGYPLLIGLLAAFAFEQVAEKGNPCVLKSQVGRGLLIYPLFILLVLQVILIVWAMVYVGEVIKSVRCVHSNFPVKYLIVRFMATFLAQLYNLVGVQTYILLPDIQKNAVFARYAFASHASGAAVDAVILTLANVDFMNWITTIIGRFSKSSMDIEMRDMSHMMAVSLSVARIDPPIDFIAVEVLPLENQVQEPTGEVGTPASSSRLHMISSSESPSDV